MKQVQKEYTINTNIENVFKALTNPIEMEHWSGAPAEMNLEKGGEFSLWGGSIIGKNVTISEHKIEQLWKESGWEDHSNVLFELEGKGNQTILKLKHSDIPEKSINDIDKGWDDYYLTPLKSYLEL